MIIEEEEHLPDNEIQVSVSYVQKVGELGYCRVGQIDSFTVDLEKIGYLTREEAEQIKEIASAKLSEILIEKEGLKNEK